MATNGYLTCEFPVFYATTEGQTRLIAERLAAVLHEHGFVSRAIDVAGPEATHVDWTHVRGAIVGASLHLGRHQRAVDRFVRAQVPDLNYLPSDFFSVSLSAASKNPQEVAEAARIATEFTETRGWKPAIVSSVAGRLAYSKYNFFIRFVIKRIAKKEGGPTDTSRDHELTDWDAVDNLAHDMAARVRARVAA